MNSRTSRSGRVLATICGVALACAFEYAPAAHSQPAVMPSQTEIQPSQGESDSGGDPVLELPERRPVPALRSQKGGPGSGKAITGGGQNALELPRVDRMSAGLLGCWTGETAAAPVKWQVTAPIGAKLGYRRDRIRLCLSGVRGKLQVNSASAEDPEPMEAQYKVIYRPVRAIGSQVDMEIKSWDPDSPITYVETGTARCVLNSDGTVTYSHSVTTFLNGKAALQAEARADLKRER